MLGTYTGEMEDPFWVRDLGHSEEMEEVGREEQATFSDDELEEYRRKYFMPIATKQTPRVNISDNGSVLSRIRPVSQYADEGIKIAIYGRSGTGKTTLASTFPKPQLVIVCSGAGETRSIRKESGIDAVKLNDEAELVELIEHQRKTAKYATVSLDHVTGYQDLILKRVLGVNALPAQLAWGTATQGQWGDVGLGMKDRLQLLLQLPCNVILVAQEREFNTENNNDILAPYVNCAASPSVTGWIGPNVDYLVQTFLRQGVIEKKIKAAGKDIVTTTPGKVEFCLRVGPHPVYSTKFRLPRGTELPDLVVNPTYTKLKALIDGATK